MPICPAGHPTSQTDFCDTCGLPLAEAGAAPVGEPLAPPVVCPHCQTNNVAEALFCEACGFDFTTGELPPAGADADPAPTPAPAVPADAPAPDSPETEPGAGGEVAPLTPPPVEWVAELWIDPQWYASQGSPDPMPSPGLPDIVPLVKPVNLIGRVSQSRGSYPDIDCELDSGCSRRHALLSTDGTRWWIEDLDSANGTFVGAAAGPLPAMPLPRGRVELTAGQRIYLGAWTRIVVRRATADEQAAFTS